MWLHEHPPYDNHLSVSQCLAILRGKYARHPALSCTGAMLVYDFEVSAYLP